MFVVRKEWFVQIKIFGDEVVIDYRCPTPLKE